MSSSYAQTFDGNHIFYKQYQGKQPLTLVFLHGVGGNWTLWKKEIKYFRRRDFPVLALDMRGHGRSSAPLDYQRYKHTYFCRDLYCVLQSANVENFALIGHSLGGGVTITYCQMYKRKYPSSVVFVETASTYPFKHNSLLNLGKRSTRFMRYLASHNFSPRSLYADMKDIDLSLSGIKYRINLLLHLLALRPLRTIVKTLDNLEEYIHKNQPKIDHTFASLRVPTLVIAADKDTTIPLRFARRIVKLNKLAVLKIIKDADHQVIVKKPHEVSETIYNFLIDNKVVQK